MEKKDLKSLVEVLYPTEINPWKWHTDLENYQTVQEYNKTKIAEQNAYIVGFTANKGYKQEDIIEMLQWINENCWQCNPPIWSNGEQMDDITGKGTYTEMSSSELFELWWEYKTKRSN